MSLIRKNFIFNNILGLTNVIVPIIVFPYISRIFGPTGIGIVSFAISLASSFVLIASLGIPIYGVREIAKVKQDKKSFSKTFSEIVIIQLVWLIITLVLFACWVFFTDTFLKEPTIRWMSFFHILGLVGLMHWFFMGIENYKFIAIINFIIKSLQVLLLFILIKGEEDYWIYYAIVVFTTILGSVISIITSLRNVELTFKKLNFSRHLKSIGILFGTQLAIGIYVNLDVVILKYLSSEEQVGYYFTANKLIRVLLKVITSLAIVSIPKLSNHIKSGEIKNVEEIISKSMNFVLFLAIPSMFLIYILAPEIIQVFAGSSFTSSISLLQYLTPLVVIIGLGSVFGVQVLVPFQKDKDYLIVVLFGSVVSVALCFVLIPKLEAFGAVLTILATEFIITFFTFLLAIKIIKLKINYTSILNYTFLSFTMCIFCNYLKFYLNGVYYLFLASFSSSCIYIIGLYLLKDSFFMNTIFFKIKKNKPHYLK